MDQVKDLLAELIATEPLATKWRINYGLLLSNFDNPGRSGDGSTITSQKEAYLSQGPDHRRIF